MLSIHDLTAIDAWRQREKFDSEHLRRLRNRLYKRHQPPDEALAALPAEVRRRFERQVTFDALILEGRHDSSIDGATKLVFRTRSGYRIETVVLRIHSGRNVVCLSTQVGCAARCEFCATGRMGMAANLSASEILDQVLHAQRLLAGEGRQVRNLVFMGMGEPLHNEPALYAAIEVLVDPRCFHLHPRRTLVSTVGIPRAMVRFASAFPEVRFAVSLHSARQAVRSRIMPIAHRHDLGELRAALLQVSAIGGQTLMIEYLLLAEVTDTEEDVAALTEYLQGIPAHINLIPYNPIADAPRLTGSSPERQAWFSAALKQAGFPVTTRYSLGSDIAAACGQLVRRQQRRPATADDLALTSSWQEGVRP